MGFRYNDDDASCGAVHLAGRSLSHRSVSSVVRYSGRATVYLLYDPGSRQYDFEIHVGGKQVNRCAIGSVASMPESQRTLPEAYDASARTALSFTVWEMERDAEQPGMDSGMDSQDLENCLEHNEDYEIVVRRTQS